MGIIGFVFYIIPFIGGFAMAFAGPSVRLERLIYIFTFGPIVLAAIAIILASGAAANPSSLSLIGIGLCLSYLPFFIGKRLGTPFFEIWQERQAHKLKETFK